MCVSICIYVYMQGYKGGKIWITIACPPWPAFSPEVRRTMPIWIGSEQQKIDRSFRVFGMSGLGVA